MGDRPEATSDVFDRQSNYQHMVHDAARYLSCIRHARYVDSLWEVKTIMPRSEQDDSRPILFRRSAEIPEIITVLGAKIDSVYDVEDALHQELGRQTTSHGAPAARPVVRAAS
jgi:hypothetical protein